jgi:hypothetical protein
MTLLQNILAFSTLAIAIVFLIKKYFFKNKKSGKNCGDCGCG